MNIIDMLTAAFNIEDDLSTYDAATVTAIEAVRSNPMFPVLAPAFFERTTKVTELDARMATKAGTISQRKAEKLEALRASESERFIVLQDEAGDREPDVDPDEFPVHYLSIMEAELAKAKDAHEMAEQAVQDAIVELLKADKADVTVELDTLKAERTELVTQATSMATLLTGASKPITPSDIGIGKARGGSSNGGSGSTATVKSGQHYRHLSDGTPKPYANDTFSGLAFYAWRKDGNGVSADELKAALTANGITDLAKPWETTLTFNGVTRTVGHRVDAPVDLSESIPEGTEPPPAE